MYLTIELILALLKDEKLFAKVFCALTTSEKGPHGHSASTYSQRVNYYENYNVLFYWPNVYDLGAEEGDWGATDFGDGDIWL